MAKALAGQPEVLLLDEVMAGLNEAELAASVEIARNVRDELGTAILWVEHVMSAVSPARRASHRPQLRQGPAEGAPEVVIGPAGRRRIPRAGPRCLRSPGWQPGTSANASSSIDVEVRTGEAVTIVGSNGAGKTTLFRAIAGLLPPMEGRVVLDGKDLTRHPAHRRARAESRTSQPSGTCSPR